MKPRNLPTRVHARRLVALANLHARGMPDDDADRQAAWKREVAVLRQRTAQPPVDRFTKKLLIGGTEARKSHRAGKLTR